MDVTAVTKYSKLSVSKARDLARKMQGLSAADALKVVQFSPRKAAALLRKTLRSAIANAENNAKLSAESLRVKQVTVDEGPRLKRFWPRARGGASPILRRTCHVRVVLTDGKDGEEAA